MSDQTLWDIAVDGQRHGPYRTDQLLEEARTGGLPLDTFVCPHLGDDWHELRETEPFRAVLASANPTSRGPAAGGSTSAAAPGRGWKQWIAPAAISAGALLVVTLLSVIAWKQVRGQTRDPEDVAKELMPVLLDSAATERARRCSEFLDNLSEFKSARPFEVANVTEDVCKLVAKGKPDAIVAGGFYVTQFEECSKLKARLPKTLADHENNLDVKVRLYCDKERKPTVDTAEASVQLAAEMRLAAKLPTVVAHVNQGITSPRISRCYFQVKGHLIDSERRVRKLRCEVLKADQDVAKVTYDALWSRARLKDRLEEYQKENKEAWEAAVKADKETEFFDRFTAEEREKACRPDDGPALEAQEAASDTALDTCS